MSLSREFSEHLRDLFAPLGPIRTRRMFGGAGVFLDDAMFALVVDDVLYMKADPELARAYEAAGSEPFSYATRNGPRTLAGFMRLPDAALDDPDEALAWARRSLVPAREAAAQRATKGRKAAR